MIRPTGAQLLTEIDPGLPTSLNPCVVWGDYDNDGDQDVLVAGLGKQDVPFTTIYRNTAGVFANSGVALLGLSRATAAWGDLDGDGDLDLAMTGLNGSGLPTTRVYRNDGSTFTALAGSFSGVFAGTVNWIDYDNDGDLDLIITGTATAGPTGTPLTKLFRNDGNSVFASVTHPFPNCYLGAVAVGDFDRDGRADIVITGTGLGNVAGIWRNDAGGNFTDIGANLPGMDIGFAAWGDYDNDGDLDLLFGGDSNAGWISRIYRNDAGTFNDIEAGLLGEIWSSAAWGDYDNDGDLDIIIIGYDPGAAVRRSIIYRNDAGTFVNIGQALHDVYLGTVNWVDFNNDGKLDISLAGNELGADIFVLYRNNTASSNTAPAAPTNLTVNVIGTSVILSWSPGSDAQTPTNGLTYNLRVGTTPGGSQIVASQSASNGYRRLTEAGNKSDALSTELRGLKPGTNYFWSVQAVDTAFAGSPFATEGSFVALADPPGTGTITLETPDSVRVAWHGTPGGAYHVWTSTNLLDWTLLATPVAQSNGVFEVVSSTGEAPAKFYRAARQ